MRLSARKAILSGLLTAAVLAGSLVAATPAAATVTSMTLDSKSVTNGTQFSVNLTVSTDQYINAGQAAITFAPTMLQCNSIVWNAPVGGVGGAFNNGYDTPSYVPAGGGALAAKINNSTGRIDFLAGSTGGSGAPGDSHQGAIVGTFVMLTVTFTPLAAANDSIQTIHLDPDQVIGSFLSNQGVIIPTTLVDGVITIGNPQFPDLIVVNQTAVAGTGAAYTVTFQVKNQGAVASTATTANVSVDGAWVANGLVVPGVAAGATSGVITAPASGSFTVSGQSDAIHIQVIPASGESNTTNNGADVTYTLYPDLVVSAAATSGTGTDPNFNLTFTITNQGRYQAGISMAGYQIAGGASGTQAIGALAAGAHQDVGPIALSCPVGNLSASILITADSTGLVNEGPYEGNNTATSFYSYQAANSGTTNVTGTIENKFSFTVPTFINWNQTPNQQLQPTQEPTLKPGYNTATRQMVVTSNKKWAVTVSGNPGLAYDQNGMVFMTKYHPGGSPTVWDQATHLANGLWIQSDPSEPDGIAPTYYLHDVAHAETLVNGQAADLLPLGDSDNILAYRGGTIQHYTRTMPVNFSQRVFYGDPALANSDYYSVIVTFTCTVTDY